MKKLYLLTALVNLFLGIMSFLLFVVFGGFDLFLGKGTPIWLSFVPGLFLIGSAINFFAVYNEKKRT